MKKKLLSILLSVAILSTSALSLLTGVSAATEATTASATDVQVLDTVGSDGEMSFDLLDSIETYSTYRDAMVNGGFSAGDANNLQVGTGKATYAIDTTTAALDGSEATVSGYASTKSLKITSYQSDKTWGWFRWSGFDDPSGYFDGLDEQLAAGNYDNVEVYLVFWAKAETDGLELTAGMYIKDSMFEDTVTLSTEWQQYKINMKELVISDSSISDSYNGLNFMQITAQGLWANGANESYVQGLRFRQDDAGATFWIDEIGIEYSGFTIDSTDGDYGVAGTEVTVEGSDDSSAATSSEETSSEEVSSTEETSSEEVTSSEETSSTEETSSEETSSTARSNEEIAADLATDIYSLSNDNWMIDNFSSYTSTDDLYSAYFNWYYNTNGGIDKSIYGGCQIINDKTTYKKVENGVEVDKTIANESNAVTTLSDGAVNINWATTDAKDSWSDTYLYPCIRWRVNQAFLGNDGGSYSLIGDGWALDITTDTELTLVMKMHVDGNSRVYTTAKFTVAAGFSGTIACSYDTITVGGVEIGSDGVEDMKAWFDKRISSGEAIVLSLGFYEDTSLSAPANVTLDNVRFYTTDSAYTTQVANARAAAAAADLTGVSEEQIALYNAAMAQVDAEYAALGGYATPAQYEAIAYKYAYAAEYVGATVTVDTVAAGTGSGSGSGSNSTSGSGSSSTSPKTGMASHVAIASILLIAAGSAAIILGKRKEEIGE